MSSREKSFFGLGAVCGAVCGTIFVAGCVILIGKLLLRSNSDVQTHLIREIDPEIDQNGFTRIPYDEKYNFVVRREERKPPELSIASYSLKYPSGAIVPELDANDEATIEFTIENKGGRAKYVGVTWKLKTHTERLEKPMLTHITKKIRLLKRDTSERYEISVKTKGVKAGTFVFDFYLVHEDSEPSFESSPYECKIFVVPKL